MSISPGAIIAIVIVIVIVILVSTIAARLVLRFLRRRTAPSDRRVSAIETALLSTASSSVLPVFTFSAIEHPDRTECTICLSPFEPEDQLRLLPLCLHAFHVSCIDTWITSHSTCPLCRLRILASDSDVMTLLADSGNAVDEESPEIHGTSDDQLPSEVQVTVAEASVPSEANLAADVASGRSRSWLGEFLDRISSSRSSSFRSSGRFTGSSRRESMGAAFAEYFRCISEF